MPQAYFSNIDRGLARHLQLHHLVLTSLQTVTPGFFPKRLTIILFPGVRFKRPTLFTSLLINGFAFLAILDLR